MIDKSFALIIPTLNRHEYIINLLNFYISLKIDIGIFIGDGSDSSLAEDIKFSRLITSNVDVHYFHLPGKHVHQTQRFLVEKVCQLEYFSAAFCGDDDFINPCAAKQMAEYLRSHQNFVSVQGRAYIGAHPLVATSQFSFHDLTDYWSHPAEYNELKIMRVCNILKKYWVPHFSVKRSIDYLSILSDEYIAIKDFSIGEIMQTVNTLALGKSHFYDCLYLIRGAHPFRGFEASPNNFVQTPENNDLITFTSALHNLCENPTDWSLVDNAFSRYKQKCSVIAPLEKKADNKIMRLISNHFFEPMKSWLPASVIRFTRRLRFPSVNFLDINQLGEDELRFIRAIYNK